MSNQQTEQAPHKSGAVSVAGGIFASRILGLLRERAISYFFGVGAHSDVIQTAFKTPNLLQNLLGEGTISAAFIPIYSRMLEEGRLREAGRFAGAVFGLLVVVTAVLTLLGVLLAPAIVTVLAPGFLDDAPRVAAGELAVNRFDLSVTAIRITFPMTGLLALAAWALGVLNSHRRFFLPYVAPTLWNIAIIGVLFGAAFFWMPNPLDIETRTEIATQTLNRLLLAACMGALLGGALQFLVQLPLVARVIKGFSFSLSTRVAGVKEAIRAFGPVVVGRGVYQLSAYLDQILGSLIAGGALGALRYAVTLYVLPVSLFGMSVAAAELPELSRISEAQLRTFLDRINRSLRQMLFLMIPTVVGYLAFGFLIVGALYQTGSFGYNDNWLVYFVLAGYSTGLVATSTSRLLQNAFYALNDTKTPAKIAILRVVVSAAVAVPLMFWLDQFAVSDVVGFTPVSGTLYLGAMGLALGSAAGAWVELWRLRHNLSARTGGFHLPWPVIGKTAGVAVLALLPGALVWWLLPAWHIALQALVVITTFASAYLAAAHLFGFPEMAAWTGQLMHRFRR